MGNVTEEATRQYEGHGEDLAATGSLRYNDRPLNVYQRKLRVMAQCDIKPDKKHSLGFEYVSIQNLSNQLRTLCAKEGLDIEITFPGDDPGYIQIELVNVDDPMDSVWSRWPVVEGDKGWAYTVKYPLVRLFLIGDPDENDEAEMAAKSGQAAIPPWNPPKSDAEFKVYADPANRVPAGPPVRRTVNPADVGRDDLVPPRARPPRGPFHQDDAA